MYRLRIASELERRWRSAIEHELSLTLPTSEGLTTNVVFGHAQTLDPHYPAYRCTVEIQRGANILDVDLGRFELGELGFDVGEGVGRNGRRLFRSVL